MAWQAFSYQGGDFRLLTVCLMYGPASPDVADCEYMLKLAERDYPGEQHSCMWLTGADRPADLEELRVMLHHAVSNRAIHCKTTEIHPGLLQIAASDQCRDRSRRKSSLCRDDGIEVDEQR
jgi:hypothetical protein